MLKHFSKGWNAVQAISIITCPGSWYALRTINDKEFLPWLEPKYVPVFGFPLLFIFCLSCVFGLKGLYTAGQEFHKRYNKLVELERQYKADPKNVNLLNEEEE